MSKYEIIIYWSQADEAFLAEVPELPGCAADGKTHKEALANVRNHHPGMDRDGQEAWPPYPSSPRPPRQSDRKFFIDKWMQGLTPKESFMVRVIDINSDALHRCDPGEQTVANLALPGDCRSPTLDKSGLRG